MSSLRAIKRGIVHATKAEQTDQPGGVCPKCSREPLGILQDCDPAIVTVCTFCRYVSHKLTRWLVLTRVLNEQTRETKDEIAERVIVQSDDNDRNAVRRCIRLGVIASRGREIATVKLDREALIPLACMDRDLTEAELDAISAANRELQEARAARA